MRTLTAVLTGFVCLAAVADAQVRMPRPTPQGIDAQIAALGSASAIDRAMAACHLAWMGERAESAIPALARLLADAAPIDQVSCRGDVFGPIVFQTGEKSTPGLEAARALGAMGIAALEPLLLADRSANADVRRHATRGLSLLRHERSVTALMAAAADAETLVRVEAARGLGMQRDLRAAPVLQALLSDRDERVRWQAAAALGVLRAATAVEPLVAVLADASPFVRERAAVSLGAIGDTRAVPALAPLLNDADPAVRERVVQALGSLRDGRAADLLIGALKDPDPLVREQAARALGRVRR